VPYDDTRNRESHLVRGQIRDLHKIFPNVSFSSVGDTPCRWQLEGNQVKFRPNRQVKSGKSAQLDTENECQPNIGQSYSANWYFSDPDFEG